MTNVQKKLKGALKPVFQRGISHLLHLTGYVPGFINCKCKNFKILIQRLLEDINYQATIKYYISTLGEKIFQRDLFLKEKGRELLNSHTLAPNFIFRRNGGEVDIFRAKTSSDKQNRGFLKCSILLAKRRGGQNLPTSCLNNT